MNNEQKIPEPGTVEYEFGVAIPGQIKPQSEWARTAIKHLPPQGALDWEALFGRKAPVVVELACGNGRYTLLSALARPTHNHLGVDLLPAVIRYATRRANQRGLHHVRFAVKDAETLVRQYLPPESVAEIHFYHPQPYHQRRDAHLRTLTPQFLADVHRALEPRGLFVTQTDSRPYWGYLRRVLPGFFDFTEQRAAWPDAPEGRSRREILARSQGLPVFRGYGYKRPLAPEDIAQLLQNLPRPTFKSHAPKRREPRHKDRREGVSGAE